MISSETRYAALLIAGNDFGAQPDERITKAEDRRFSYPRSAPVGLSAREAFGLSEGKLPRLRRITKQSLAIDAVEMLLDAEIAMDKGELREYSRDERSAIARASMGTTWIYFVASVDYGAVKIGKAKNLASRFSALKSSSPVPLAMGAAIRFIPECEEWLHNIFSHLRLHGEWFDAAPELVDMMRTAKDQGTRGVLEKIHELRPSYKCLDTVF